MTNVAELILRRNLQRWIKCDGMADGRRRAIHACAGPAYDATANKFTIAADTITGDSLKLADPAIYTLPELQI